MNTSTTGGWLPAPEAGRLTLISAASVPRSEVEWLIPQRVPLGGITVLAGDPGLGKSMFSAYLAAGVSTGKFGGTPGVTIMSSAEDGLASTITPRLEAAGADMHQIQILDQKEPLVLPAGTKALRALIETLRPRLLVIDPVMAHLDVSVNSHKDQSMRSAFAPLRAIAEEYGVAIVLIGHLNKTPATNPLHRLGGSIAFPGLARSVLMLAADPDDPDGPNGRLRVLAQAKSNVGDFAATIRYAIKTVRLEPEDAEPFNVPVLCDAGFSTHTAQSLFADATADSSLGRLEEAMEWLDELLRPGQRRAADVLELALETGITERTLDRAKAELGVKSRRFGCEWYWQLPERSQAA